MAFGQLSWPTGRSSTRTSLCRFTGTTAQPRRFLKAVQVTPGEGTHEYRAGGVYPFSRGIESSGNLYRLCCPFLAVLCEILEWLDRDISHYYGGDQRDRIPVSIS